MSRRRPILSLLLALALFTAACGGDDGKEEGSDGSGTTSGGDTTTAPTAPPPPPVYPFTGLPADPAILARPALVVKIDNADGAGRANQTRPQIGINQADVVYEEMVEGSVTRLAALFHSTDSDPVGPVRSARSTDVMLMAPLNVPLFAWSGANADFAAMIRESALVDIGYDTHSDLYYRSGDRVAPHNVYSSTQALYSQTPAGALPPPALFAFRAAGEALPATAVPVGSIHIEFGSGAGNAPVDYTWNPAVGGFARDQRGTPHVDEAGVQVTPQNVIVQFVEYIDTGYVDSAGTLVPEAALVGGGSCWVLTAGTLTPCTWSKPAPEAVTQYVDAAGAPIKLTPGRTWVELVPPEHAAVTA